MAVLQIPVRNDIDLYNFTIDLESKTFGFQFRYNGRSSRWIFDLSDSLGNSIFTGVPVAVGNLPFYKLQNESKPLGDIFFLDTSGNDLDPTQDDFGTRVIMIYVESGTA